jgi:arylsulfatase A-like enzyme
MNLKGNTPQSLRDAVGYLRTRQRKGVERPVFVFINLMETHLPYSPTKRFIRRFAPILRQDRQARDFVQSYNLEHYRWMLPLKEPLTELQDRVINDMYDAELAYEDHLLRWLLHYLDEPEVHDNTLVIITSDHGEGLNHHNFVGHSLVVYDDLIRVPLIVRYPPLYPESKRVTTLVSTRRVFHSALEAAGIYSVHSGSGGKEGVPMDIEGLSLARSLDNTDPEKGIVFCEAYTPETLVALMEDDDPESVKTHRWRSTRRAVCRENYKLITVGDEPDELFDVIRDPGELDNLVRKEPEVAAELERMLVDFRFEAEARRPEKWEAARLRFEEDKDLVKRLRGLGYLG